MIYNETAVIPGPKLESGVSRQLAEYRKAAIKDISYKLELDIPRLRKDKIEAQEVLSFHLNVNQYPLQLDFRESAAKIKSFRVNDKTAVVKYQNEHLVIAPEYLVLGKNKVELSFEAGEGALNRNENYLYTLFVPDRARTVFPCFDQPDLKATYTLTLKLPADWKSIANASLKDSVVTGDRKTLYYNTSDTISTYLFAFAAGKFERASGHLVKGEAEYLYRETDTAKIKQSIKEAFAIHTSSLKFLEEWTGIPYPFQKFGFVAIPDFQFGGMEHPGAIQYKASAMFLDGGATKDQLDARSNVIAHETAHMWFGDLVTMNWFTDVWMKEVFANFMADKSMEAVRGKAVFDLKFLVDHFPAAYAIDRTQGSNPIRQDLDNLKDAGTLYGNIIYHKAPIMMRQLERLMGKDRFQQGVREYLLKFANGNASWPDLIGILDKYSDADLQKWNKVWVNDTGRPVIDYVLEQKNNKISKLTISQAPEYGDDGVWPQLFEVKFYYADHSKELSINLDSDKTIVKEAEGMDVPLFLQFNSSGQGYGLWAVDEKMLPGLYDITEPLNRASAYISLYENMLNGRSVTPGRLLDLFAAGLKKEKEELNVKLLTGYLANIYWEFITAKEREIRSVKLEELLWEAMKYQSLPNNKKLLFKAFQDVFLSENGRNRLYEIWAAQKAPQGIKLTEDDYTSMAFSLALRADEDTGILKKQLARITNADRRKRFEFIVPAISANEAVRDDFFKSLMQKTSREKEPNVVAALYYLHHPLRQATSIKYLPESLALLTEIQATGDIFFPQNWLQAIFSYYQSAEAAQIIRDFLKQNPNYNPKLKTKILQAADHVFRAQQLLRN
jgi:aminopeptidase N